MCYIIYLFNELITLTVLLFADETKYHLNLKHIKASARGGGGKFYEQRRF